MEAAAGDQRSDTFAGVAAPRFLQSNFSTAAVNNSLSRLRFESRYVPKNDQFSPTAWFIRHKFAEHFPLMPEALGILAIFILFLLSNM